MIYFFIQNGYKFSKRILFINTNGEAYENERT